MRKKIRKWFWAWNFDEEEKWLNEMAAKGLVLVAIGYGSYTFEECLPGEYNIRLELLENYPSNPQSENYIKFIEETDAEYLGAVMRWAYFRKKVKYGTFDLYSDFESRIKHMKRIQLLLGVLVIPNVYMGIYNISLRFIVNSQASLYIGIISLCCAMLIGYGFFKVNRKKSKLKKEKQLFE